MLDGFCEHLSILLLYRPETFMFFGVSLLVLSFILFISAYFIFRHNHISISTKPFPTDIDEKIISTYAKKYFEKLFKVDHIDTEIYIFRKKIEVIAYIPNCKKDDIPSFLQLAKKELTKLFKDKFSFENDFIISFKSI